MNLFKVMAMAVLLLNTPLALAVETTGEGGAPARAAAAAPAVTRVNVNTADVMALTALKGVGEKKAQAIIAYRKAHGAFTSLEQLEAVPGIGPGIIARNKHLIVFR